VPLNVSVMLQTIEEMCVLHSRTQAIDELHVSTQAIDELHVFDCVFTVFYTVVHKQLTNCMCLHKQLTNCMCSTVCSQ